MKVQQNKNFISATVVLSQSEMALTNHSNALQSLLEDVTELQTSLARERDNTIRPAGSTSGVSRERIEVLLKAISENLRLVSDNLGIWCEYPTILDICGRVLTSLGIGSLGADSKRVAITLLGKLPFLDMIHTKIGRASCRERV